VVQEATLLDPKDRGALRAELVETKKPIVFHLDALLVLADPVRFAALEVMSAAVDARFNLDGNLHPNLIDGVLAHSPPPDNVPLVRSLKMAALEVAVLQFGDALDVTCGRVAVRLRELKIRGIRTDALLEEAKQIQTSLAKGSTHPPAEPVRVRDVLADAPGPEDLIIPPGWEVSETGVRLPGDEPALVVPVPLLITGRAYDMARREEMVTLAWPRDARWRRRTVERVEIADARRVVALANTGLPVTSITARDVVGYLADFERYNLARLPPTPVSRQMGWIGKEGEDGFLLGSHFATKEGVLVADGSNGTVQYVGADEGDEQLALGLCRRGTLDGWLQALAPVDKFPRVKLGLYVACVPPLLRVLEANNFAFGYSGPTTGGKTVSLRVAASVWGCPDESSAHAILFTWDGTACWRERAPGVLRNLPLLLDDTQRARRKQDVEQTIYDVSQGRGRGRGSPKGLARQMAWETILMTSGEKPLASFTEAGGTRARCLEIWGCPFQEKNKETGVLVRNLNRAVKGNYGHAGPLFVQFLLKHRPSWKEWRAQYLDLVKQYEDKAGDNVLAGRLADPFASIRLSAQLLHQAIQLPWAFADPIDPLWNEMVQEAGEGDRSAAALQHVMDWAVSHQADFYQGGPREDDHHQPGGGWAGVWPNVTLVPIPGAKRERNARPWEFIGFFPAKLGAILEQGGFDLEATVRAWKDRGWLRATEEDGARRTRAKVKIGSKTAWVVAITRDAVVEAGAE
jgi:hypothetical protein